MDVDGDVDSQLLQQFSSMATTDREVLIAEFQRLLGNQLSDAGCAFFLDMNNWQGILLFSDSQCAINIVFCRYQVANMEIGSKNGKNNEAYLQNPLT